MLAFPVGPHGEVCENGRTGKGRAGRPRRPRRLTEARPEDRCGPGRDEDGDHRHHQHGTQGVASFPERTRAGHGSARSSCFARSGLDGVGRRRPLRARRFGCPGPDRLGRDAWDRWSRGGGVRGRRFRWWRWRRWRRSRRWWQRRGGRRAPALATPDHPDPDAVDPYQHKVRADTDLDHGLRDGGRGRGSRDPEQSGQQPGRHRARAHGIRPSSCSAVVNAAGPTPRGPEKV